jgi:hypothetical protein
VENSLKSGKIWGTRGIKNILYLALPQILGGCNGIYRPKNGLKIPPYLGIYGN